MIVQKNDIIGRSSDSQNVRRKKERQQKHRLQRHRQRQIHLNQDSKKKTITQTHIRQKTAKRQSPSGCLLVVCHSVKSHKGNAWQYFDIGNTIKAMLGNTIRAMLGNALTMAILRAAAGERLRMQGFRKCTASGSSDSPFLMDLFTYNEVQPHLPPSRRQHSLSPLIIAR